MLNTIQIIPILAYTILYGVNYIQNFQGFMENIMRNEIQLNPSNNCMIDQVLNIYSKWCMKDNNNNNILIGLRTDDFNKMKMYRTNTFFSSGILEGDWYTLSQNENYDYLFQTYIDYNVKNFNNSLVLSTAYLLKSLNKIPVDIFLPCFEEKYEYNIEKNVKRVYYEKFIEKIKTIKEGEMIGNKLSKNHYSFMKDMVKNYMVSYTNITTDSNCIINTIRDLT